MILKTILTEYGIMFYNFPSYNYFEVDWSELKSGKNSSRGGRPGSRPYDSSSRRAGFSAVSSCFFISYFYLVSAN